MSSHRDLHVLTHSSPTRRSADLLLSALAGLIPPADGRATIDGGDLAALAPRERARRIGYLPQLGEIAWDLSVRNLVALGGLPHGGPGPGDRKSTRLNSSH